MIFATRQFAFPFPRSLLLEPLVFATATTRLYLCPNIKTPHSSAIIIGNGKAFFTNFFNMANETTQKVEIPLSFMLKSHNPPLTPDFFTFFDTHNGFRILASTHILIYVFRKLMLFLDHLDNSQGVSQWTLT